MTEEDEEFERIEREAKIKGQPYHFKPRKNDDDDIQDYVRPWVELTEDEVFAISNTMPYANRFEFAKAIQAKLREKNK
jgi:hypothetical protein